MDDLRAVGLVVVGSASSLVGTLLAHWLQYRREREDRKRERLRERLGEVHRWMVVCLKMGDAVVGRKGFAGQKLDEEDLKALVARVERSHGAINALEATGSGLVMYCEDDVLEGLMREVGAVTGRLQDELQVIYDGGVVTKKAVVARQELLEVGSAVRARLEKLME